MVSVQMWKMQLNPENYAEDCNFSVMVEFFQFLIT